MKIIACLLCVLAWLYILHVLHSCNLSAWYFFVGSAGLFILMIVFLRPITVEPLARMVASISGVIGKLTGMYQTFFRYSVIFIESPQTTITLQIDLECSGILEIMAYVSLLTFFQVYNKTEKMFVGVLGVVGIILANALRITVICIMIYFGGMNVYFVAHAIVGRLLFYVITVVIYFYAFTKPQIIRTKVGNFMYGNS